MALRKTPQFREMVRMLSAGKSVWSVTEWFMSQPGRLEFENFTFESARIYINDLSLRIRKLADSVPRQNLKPLQEALKAEHRNTRVTNAIVGLPDQKPSDMDRAITKEIETMEVMRGLQYAYAIQQERVIQLRQLEKTASVVFPFGTNLVLALEKIARTMWHVQAGEALLRSKNAWPTTSIGSGPATIDLLPEVKEVAALDSVDKNLIRDALTKTLDLLHLEIDGEPATKLETQPGGTEAPQGRGNP